MSNQRHNAPDNCCGHPHGGAGNSHTPGSFGFAFAIAAILVELFFLNFNKVPFTCSYLPAKSHLAFLAGAYLYGFTIYTFTMASLELWVAATPQRMLAFFLFIVGILIAISIYRRHTQDRTIEIVYEDDADPLIRQLNLS